MDASYINSFTFGFIATGCNRNTEPDKARVKPRVKHFRKSHVLLRKYISYSMYCLTPGNYLDLRTILLNRLPQLTDSEIEILIDIYMST